MTNSELIATYIRAKDTNRPKLMPSAFAPDALLEMVVNSDAIAFPPRTTGIDAVTDVLVRRFCDAYEDVHTFCLCAAPASDEPQFQSAWLVGMVARADGSVRVGSGRYEWSFRGEGAQRRVDRLTIKIERMEVLAAGRRAEVIGDLRRLPYPWCPMDVASPVISRIGSLDAVVRA